MLGDNIHNPQPRLLLPEGIPMLAEAELLARPTPIAILLVVRHIAPCPLGTPDLAHPVPRRLSGGECSSRTRDLARSSSRHLPRHRDLILPIQRRLRLVMRVSVPVTHDVRGIVILGRGHCDADGSGHVGSDPRTVIHGEWFDSAARRRLVPLLLLLLLLLLLVN